MINAVILDDEKNCVETLQWKLNHYCPDVTIQATFNDPRLCLDYLREHPIELLFLDIEMPHLNGFDVLEALPQIDFDVIFTTAYDNYGIQAVKFSALDYLLKPVRNKELSEAVERHIQKSVARDPRAQIENLLRNLQAEAHTGKPVKITLATKESLELVNPSEIIYCESDSNYTTVFLNDGRKKIISRTLREFEEMLEPFQFCRTHNSFLVNMDEVREYVKSEGGYLILKNGKTIPVSKAKREKLLTFF
jgi:two-component system, LytTR family, response regulator